ncbi:MAG: Ig-like domain-containing protein [bacterium]|nr:Ig-like domain-containing protein [bacterium]
MKKYTTLSVVIATAFISFVYIAHAQVTDPRVPPKVFDTPSTSKTPTSNPIPAKSPVATSSTSSAGSTTTYESPLEKGVENTKLFFVTDISFTKSQDILGNDRDVIELKGTAQAYSKVTLYIFSTPIIVTVVVNADGKWSYKLDQPLEEGRHTVYVATVDASGKIVEKSAPVYFTQDRAQIEIEPSESLLLTSLEKGFWETYLIAIISIIGALAVIAAITAIGLRNKRPV